jgi:hypothetical protein
LTTENISRLARQSDAHLDSQAKYVSIQTSDRHHESAEISPKIFSDQFAFCVATSIGDESTVVRT